MFLFEKREPGYLKANFHAFSYALAHIEEPLSIEFIKKIHLLSLKDVSKTYYDKDEYNLGAQIGQFRQGIRGYGLTPDFFCMSGLAEIFNKIETKHPYLYLTVVDPEITISIDSQMLKNLSKTEKDKLMMQVYICIQKAPSSKVMLMSCLNPKEIEAYLNQFITEFNHSIANAQNDQQKLRAIFSFVKNSEHLHPFHDGNGRTFYMVIFYQLLIKNGFKLPLMHNINRLSGYSLSELEAEIQQGWDNAEILRTEKTFFDIDTRNLIKMAPERSSYLFSCLRLLFSFASSADKEKVDELNLPSIKTPSLPVKSSITTYPDTLYGSLNAVSPSSKSFHRSAINTEIVEKVNTLFKLEKCFFWDSSSGLSIELPRGTSAEKIEEYASFLINLGIKIEIKQEQSFAAELKIQEETPQSLNEKLNAAIQNTFSFK